MSDESSFFNYMMSCIGGQCDPSIRTGLEMFLKSHAEKELVEGNLPVPRPLSGPGLYAVVSPDEVVLRVVDHGATSFDVMMIMVDDFFKRYYVPAAESWKTARVAEEEMVRRGCELFWNLGRLYRLDKLPDVGEDRK